MVKTRTGQSSSSDGSLFFPAAAAFSPSVTSPALPVTSFHVLRNLAATGSAFGATGAVEKMDCSSEKSRAFW